MQSVVRREALLLALLASGTAHADVLNDRTGARYSTIQAAVDDASEGDALYVEAGTYAERVVIGKDLEIAGAGVDQVTVRWSGGGVDPVIRTSGAKDVVLSGMTVLSPSVRGIQASLAASLTLTNMAVSGSSDLGGAIQLSSTTAILDQVTVRGAEASGAGGGIYASSTDLTITNSVFEDNVAPTGDAGAIYATGGSISIVDATFSGNMADDNGGAITLDGVGAVTLTRLTLCGNSATQGGALWVAGSGGLIENGVFMGNQGNAAAIQADGPGWRMVNNTFLGHIGPRILEIGDLADAAEIRNSLFADSLSSTAIQLGAAGDPVISYNLFFEVARAVQGGNLDAGNREDLDPVLESYTGDCATDQLYARDETSPLIDRGAPSAAYNDPDGSRNDIGAYGGPNSAAFVHDDGDNDGVTWLTDCDDDDDQRYQGNTEKCDYVDNDCNGIVDDEPTDGVLWWPDVDGDGYGDATDVNAGVYSCAPGPNRHVLDATDCNDSDPDINPGVEEDCSAVDLNCDGDPHAGADTLGIFFPDRDDDSWGDPSGRIEVCAAPDGYVNRDGDCNDADATIHPDAGEAVCDGIDQNCSGDESDHVDARQWWPDVDGDGYGDALVPAVWDCLSRPQHVNVGDDCADDDPTRFPGNPEVCDGVDNDCNLVPDDGTPLTRWWPDADGDGQGSEIRSQEAFCRPGDEWIQQGGDCDDDAADVFTGAPEVCDGVDNDCDGLVDLADDDVQSVTVYEDLDGDGYGTGEPLSVCDPTGYATVDGDCADFDAEVNPGATEVADNDIDENCDEVRDNAPSDVVHKPLERKTCGCDAAAAGWPGLGALWGLVALIGLRRRK